MGLQGMNFILIPEEEMSSVKSLLQEVLSLLKSQQPVQQPVPVKNITAREFMEAVKIKRTKFDELVKTSKIRIIKKKRKIYVPVAEIDRYFNDPTV